MNSYFKNLWILYLKDLKCEFRSIDNMASTIVFGLMVTFIISLSLQNLDMESINIFPSLLWVVVLFTVTLGVNRSFDFEKENKAHEALIMAVGDWSCIFFAKVISNLTLLFVVEAIIIPLYIIFNDIRFDFNYGFFLLTLILGSCGLSLIGTLLNSIILQIRGSKLLLPVLLFPLSIPLFIAVTECTKASLIAGYIPVRWVNFLILFDLIHFFDTIIYL